MSTSIRNTLKLEGFALLSLSILLYASFGGTWLLFIALLLLPDIFMLGYLAGPKVGAFTYNIVHSYFLPACLLATGLFMSHTLILSLGLIWFAHIGLDRMLGYGLKHPDGFEHTHLSNA